MSLQLRVDEFSDIAVKEALFATRANFGGHILYDEQLAVVPTFDIHTLAFALSATDSAYALIHCVTIVREYLRLLTESCEVRIIDYAKSASNVNDSNILRAYCNR